MVSGRQDDVQSSNNDGENDSNDISNRQITSPTEQEPGTLPKRKTVEQIDNEEERTNHATKQRFVTETPLFCKLQIFVVLSRQLVLSTEGRSVPD